MTTPAAQRRIIDSDGRAKVYRPLSDAERRAAREAGLAAYAEERFFEAHELLEPAWMGSAIAAERDLDQGLIKLAAAYVHAQRGNALGMRKNLDGARKRLGAVVERHGAAGDAAQRDARVDARRLLVEIDAAIDRLAQTSPPDRGAETAKADGSLLELIPPPTIPRDRG